MPVTQATLQVKGIGKQKMAAVIARAKQLGMTPQRYLRHLVDEDLAVSERAKRTPFEQLLGEGAPVDESELDRLVDRARTRYHEKRGRMARRKD
jgi:hypothetical protein